MSKLTTIETRLEALIDAHRHAAARQEGLMMACRAIFPLIKLDPALKQRRMTIAYDALSEHMDRLGFDEEFSAIARASVDEVFSSL